MRTIYILGILVLLALAVPAAPAQASGVVTVCDEVHLLAALAGGGTVTFACGGVITLTNTITIVADTTIDASGQEVTINGNNAVRVFTVNEGIALNLTGLIVANGSADFAGGIFNRGTLTVSNSTLSGNSATATAWPHGGGGIYNEGTVTANNGTFTGNSAAEGGGIYNSSGVLTVNSCVFHNNTTTGGSGGAIYNHQGTVTATNSNFSSNRANYPGSGGGIVNHWGAMTVSNTTFSNNVAVGGTGGGIQNEQGELAVNGSTFSGNISTGNGFGGGISSSIIVQGMFAVSNSTFSANRAQFGGGIFSASFDTNTTVINSTFSGNRADSGGGNLLNGVGSRMTLANTIVANSPSGDNCSGPIDDGGGNLSYPDTTCPGINSDPMLGPLQDNGGPTWTMALGEGSAAIDAADDAICAAPPVNNLDQRGFPRPWGAHCDIGAVEQVQEPVAVRLSTINAGSTPGAVAPTAVAGLLLLALGGCAAWGRRQTQQVG